MKNLRTSKLIFKYGGGANVYTPKGCPVQASIISGEFDDRGQEDIDRTENYENITVIDTYGGHSSTLKFNCHGYAWHGSNYAIDNQDEYYEIGYEERYWQDFDDASYTEVPTYPGYPGKVSYGGSDHSAVIALNPGGYVISKWGTGPLVVHAPDNCPYPSGDLQYYKLNPKIVEGSTDVLCDYDERTFRTDITHMPQALTWTHETDYLTLVVKNPPDPSYLYTVKVSGIGAGWVNLNITTLSGFYRNLRKEFPVNKKQRLINQKVDGTSYYYGMGICPGEHSLSVTPVGGDAPITWIVPSGIQSGVGSDDTTLDFFLYPFSPSSFTITAKSVNSCGTDSRSFYLTKDWCGYGMTLYPNPASDNVTVTMIENIPLVKYSDTTITGVAMTDAKADGPTTYTIRIYNSQGTLLSAWTRIGKDFNIPLINMRDGTYIIEVNDGKNSYRKQLIVKHN